MATTNSNKVDMLWTPELIALYESAGSRPTGKGVDLIKSHSDRYPSLIEEIRKGLPKQFSIVESSNDQSFIALLKEDYQEIKNNLSLDKLQLLVTEIQNRNLGKTISILEEGKVVASSFYIVSGNRLIQLCNAKRINYSINFNTFIVDFMIKKYTKKGLVLDFEGSSIKGVNEFNSSFRAENKYLKEYQNLKF